MTVVSCAELYCAVLNTTADLSVWRKYQTTKLAGSLLGLFPAHLAVNSPISPHPVHQEEGRRKTVPNLLWFGSFPTLQIRMKSLLIYQSLQVIAVFK